MTKKKAKQKQTNEQPERELVFSVEAALTREEIEDLRQGKLFSDVRDFAEMAAASPPPDDDADGEEVPA